MMLPIATLGLKNACPEFKKKVSAVFPYSCHVQGSRDQRHGHCRGGTTISDAVFVSLLPPTVWCLTPMNINRLIQPLKEQGLRNSTSFQSKNLMCLKKKQNVRIASPFPVNTFNLLLKHPHTEDGVSVRLPVSSLSWKNLKTRITVAHFSSSRTRHILINVK